MCTCSSDQLEMFDRRELKAEGAGGLEELRRMHGGQPCGALCLNAQPSSPCECHCGGICHSTGRCIVED